jgi:hypothetical protein
MTSTPGNGPIGVGAFLVALSLLDVVFVTECAALLGCYLPLPSIFSGFDATLGGLFLMLVGVMLVVLGAVLRARALLPRRLA